MMKISMKKMSYLNNTITKSYFFAIVGVIFNYSTSFGTYVEEGSYHTKIVKEDPSAKKLFSKKDKEVIEYFTYMCHACHALESHVVKWCKTKDASIKFVKIPLTFGIPGLIAHAKGYEIAKHYGKDDAFSKIMFENIHEEGQYMNTKKQIIDLLVLLGIARGKIINAFDSSLLEKRIFVCEKERKQKNIIVMPTIMVNNNVVTPVTAKGYDKVFNVVNELLLA